MEKSLGRIIWSADIKGDQFLSFNQIEKRNSLSEEGGFIKPPRQSKISGCRLFLKKIRELFCRSLRLKCQFFTNSDR